MSSPTQTRIDGLQIANWSRETLLENQVAGVHGINATCAVWEGPTETMQRVGELYQLLRHNSDVARLVLSADDLDQSIEDGIVGVILGFQNTSPFGDDFGLVEVFHRLGIRVAQLTYNIQNVVGGSCYDTSDSGLTRFGRNIIAEMNRVGMVVDLSHVGNRTSRDAVDASAQPTAITHANPLSYFDTPRNKPNDVIKAVADSGGIVGLCLYPNVIGGAGATLSSFCQMVADVAEQVGIDQVALASDSVRGWDDGYVSHLRNGRWRAPDPAAAAPTWPEWPEWYQGPQDFDRLATGLTDVGMASGDLDKVMGLNWQRYFREIFDA